MDQVLVSTPKGLFTVDAESGHISSQMNDSASSLIVPVGTVGQEGVTGSRVICCPQSSKALLHYWRLNAGTGVAESSGNPVYKCSGPEKFTAMAFSTCGGLMFCGAAGGTVYVWQTWTGNLLKSWTGHFGAVTCVAVSQDDSFLFTASEDTTIKSYFLPDLFESSAPVPVPTGTLAGHSAAINHLVVSDSLLVTASKDRSVKVVEWSYSGLTQVNHFALPREPSRVCINHAHTEIYAGCVDGSVVACNLRDSGIERFRGAHKGSVSGIAITLDCSRITTCSEDGLMIWDVASKMLIQAVIGPNQQLKNALALLMIRKPALVPDHVREAQPFSFEKRFISSIDMYLQFKPLQRTLTPIDTIDVVPLIRAAVSSDSAGGPKIKNGICLTAETASNASNFTSREDAIEKLELELTKQRELSKSWAVACSGLYRRLLALTGEDVEIAIPLPGSAAPTPPTKKSRK